ncbi:MAG TPA: NAD-dependent epimerase/dehydratase family protein [Chryseolinea sp.]|nr:NAD-dependent epimerase/dehydratase family protein [Chryseolinea sp.]
MRAWIKQQRICVTGGGGVLGQRLVRELLKCGTKEVVVLDQQRRRSGKALSLSVQYVVGSILKKYDLESAIRGCKTVFHLAALTHAGRSDNAPARYWETNCSGTVKVLEACRKLGVQRIVYTSTGHVYGIPIQLPVNEDHTTRPISNYAASKLAGEAAIQAYVASYGLSGIIARLSNLYGIGFGANTVVGLVLEQAVKGGPLMARNMEAVRDFTYLDDAVEALLRLAAMEMLPTECRTINVSNGHGVSVENIVRTIQEVVKRQLKVLHRVNIIPNHTPEKIPSFILDNRLLHKLTGWVPSISLESGLTRALRESRAKKSLCV